MQGDRQSVHHQFTVAQNRQIVLFTIAVPVSGSHHLINIYTLFQSLDIKGDGSRALGINAVVLCLLPNHLVGLRVDNLHTGVAAHLLVGSIEEFHHDGALIALTKEARHVWLHHHGLLSHSLIHQQTIAHLLVMSQAHELPSSHAFRQGKVDSHIALIVALQGRIEEGGLVQVFTHLNMVECRFIGRRKNLIRSSTSKFFMHHHFFLQNQVHLRKQRLRRSSSETGHLRATNSHDFRLISNLLVFLYTNSLNGSAIRTFQLAQFHRLHISIIAKEFAIKLIHIQLLLVIILSRIDTQQIHRIIFQIAPPIAAWQPLAESQRHSPAMLSQLVERLVIEHTHQLCLGWLAVRSGNLQGPLLLLSRSKTVAESLPGNVQFLLRQRT